MQAKRQPVPQSRQLAPKLTLSADQLEDLLALANCRNGNRSRAEGRKRQGNLSELLDVFAQHPGRPPLEQARSPVITPRGGPWEFVGSASDPKRGVSAPWCVALSARSGAPVANPWRKVGGTTRPAKAASKWAAQGGVVQRAPCDRCAGSACKLSWWIAAGDDHPTVRWE